LSASQRTALCEAGFSGARYVDFGTKTQFGRTSCGGKTFDYEKGSSASAHDIMRDIHSVIENPGKGPILVHCMWACTPRARCPRWRSCSSCGWPESRAKAYWHKARKQRPVRQRRLRQVEIDGRLASFRVDPALKISAEQQRKICPQ